ncbi:MAG: threonine-phosphate decarboxylase, partial [Candidatus Omnitrophota bacterium]|nr:threonine-phosphate decarboxylase [Candidatus Omnitrophota bacterium]
MHGGNIKKISDLYGIPRDRLIDFSTSINPLRISRGINSIIKRINRVITDYPDPECILLRRALAGYTGIGDDNIVAGNGSNELIHLIPRSLGC